MTVELTSECEQRANAVMRLTNDAWPQPVIDALGVKQATTLNALLKQLNTALFAATESRS